MRIGMFVQVDRLDDMVEAARRAKSAGFGSVWSSQIFGLDALTAIAVAGREVPGLDWGTAVVPTYPRHPVALAMQALTTNAAVGGRLTLGVGPSHQIVVETLHGLDYSRPGSHTEEYLKALVPLLTEGRVASSGEQVSATMTLTATEALGVPVLISALAPRMLKLAGTLAAGTVTWMTGPKTVQSHIVPTIRAAAAEAGRPAPRVVVALPVAVTEDEASAREAAAQAFSVYGTLPAYRRVLDREGAAGPGDVIIAGDESKVRDAIESFPATGATDLVVVPFGDAERTTEFVGSLIA